MSITNAAYLKALDVGTGAEVIISGESFGLFEQNGDWSTLLAQNDNPDQERYGLVGDGEIYAVNPENGETHPCGTLTEDAVTGRIVPWLQWVDGELLPVPTP